MKASQKDHTPLNPADQANLGLATGFGTEYLSTLADKVVLFRLLIDKEWTIEQASDNCFDILGLKPEELIHSSAKDLYLHEEELTVAEAQFAEAVKTRSCATSIFKAKHLDGSLVNMSASYRCVSDAQNNPLYVEAFFADITAIVEIGKALKESENRFETFASSAFEGIGIAVNGIIVDVNNRLVEISGYERGELIGESLLKLIHTDDQSIVKKHIASGEDSNYEFKLVRKNGEVRHILSHGSFIKYNGDDARIAGLYDITEAIEAKDALKESEQRYNRLTSSASEGIGISIGGVVEEANNQLLQMMGYTMEEFYGQQVFQFIHPDDLEFAMHHIEQGSGAPYQIRLVRKDGSIFEADIRESKINFNSQDANITIIQDLTEIKATENALIESEKRFRSIVQDQTEMIVRWQPGGIRTFVNDAYCKAYGVKREDIIGTSFYDLISKEDRKRVKERLAKITPENRISSAIHNVILPDGTVGWNRWTDRGFFDDDGNILEYQSVGRDITTEQKVAQRIAKSEKRLSLIYNSTKDFMGLVRVEGKHYIIESVNAVFEQINTLYKAGLAKEEVEGMHFAYFLGQIMNLSEEDVRSRLDRYDQVVQSQKATHYLQETTIGDQTIYSETFLNPIINDGEVTHLLWVSHDVTEQRIAERKLEKAFEEVKRLKAELENENVYLREEIELVHNFENMVFASEEFHSVLTQVEQVAATDATVLIQGETGTGKELIARAIHNTSDRSDKPMIKVNCAAIPKELIESELFGHEKGSFTGAINRKPGKFELADKGTLFLDEIGELPVDLQPKLLRALQEGEIQRVGGDGPFTVNVRVIAATNKDLQSESASGNFREDLYFRLNVFPVVVPPLRERREDIPILIDHFVQKYSTKHKKDLKFISDEALNYLKDYDWPGNIRELENVIERAVILSSGESLKIPQVKEDNSSKLIRSGGQTLADVQRNHILKVLAVCDWKIGGKNGASEMLDLKPSTLRDKMKKLGIQRIS